MLGSDSEAKQLKNSAFVPSTTSVIYSDPLTLIDGGIISFCGICPTGFLFKTLKIIDF
jgi:hypothetical protein